MMNDEKMKNVRLQFITHCTERYSYLESARLALAGGCRWVQLRMKGATDKEVEPMAREVQRLCREYGATFVIDDRVELAKKLGADGVHLGKHDMPVSEARRILGDTYIIGGTANTFDEVLSHYHAGADYIGCGPFRYTTTKQNLSPILGPEGYRSIIRRMQENGILWQVREACIGLPVIAIGGITLEDIPNLLQTGVSGIALSGTVLRAEEPVKEMERIREIMSVRCTEELKELCRALPDGVKSAQGLTELKANSFENGLFR